MSQPSHIIFIHGLSNKPPVEDLRRVWIDALAEGVVEDPGFDLGAVGVKDSFVYWADLFYDEPLSAAGYESRSDELADSFNKNGIRDTIRKRVTDDLAQVGDDSPVVLVGHSQGSFIAYDVLTGVKDCPMVDGLLTLGSPLGVDEVQDKLVWSPHDGFPKKLRGDWVNVYDPFDVVARLDPKLSNDFKKNGDNAVIDVKEENWGKWRHSATKYLKGPKLRSHLKRLAGRA